MSGVERSRGNNQFSVVILRLMDFSRDSILSAFEEVRQNKLSILCDWAIVDARAPSLVVDSSSLQSWAEHELGFVKSREGSSATLCEEQESAVITSM